MILSIKNFKSYENCYFVIYEELVNSNYVEKILKKTNLEKDKNIDLQFFRNSNKNRT